MSIGELIEAIESVEFDATMGLISGFERFVRLALLQPQTRGLLQAMSSRSVRVLVEERTEQLIEECLGLTQHVHPRDIALAVYMLALHEIGSAQTSRLAGKLVDNRISWWSNRVAQRVLSLRTVADAQGLRFQFDWSEADDDPTKGRLQVWVGGQPVWRDGATIENRGVLATWSELLERLSVMWPRIIWEDGFPAPLDARDPSEFGVKTRDYLDAIPARLVSHTRALLDEFRANHDLSKATPVDVEPLWLVRQGEEMWVCTDSSEVCVRRPHREVVAALRALGDEIAARLAANPTHHTHALEAWEHAEAVDTESAIAISTGLERGEVQQLGGGHAFEFSIDDPAQTELMAAARMLVTADYRSALRTVLEIVRTVPPSPSTTRLDTASAAARQQLEELPLLSKPHEQGYAAANWLREQLGAGDAPISPQDTLESWGVGIIRAEFSEPEIEAIAVWGPRHGPAIILNTRSKSSSNRENITLAHEIAHLLLDRDHALPLAEVLGGNVPKLVEQRARAFAAEILLPREIASAEFARVHDADTARIVLEALARRFGVSHEVIAWQVRNSDQILPRAVEGFLRSQVSKPASY